MDGSHPVAHVLPDTPANTMIDAYREYVVFLKAALARAEQEAVAARQLAAEAGRMASAGHAHAEESGFRAAVEIADAQARAAEAVEQAQIHQDQAERRLAHMVAERQVILGSTAWKASAPLRAMLDRTPAVRRMLRRSAELAWYLGTLQNRRTATRRQPFASPDQLASVAPVRPLARVRPVPTATPLPPPPPEPHAALKPGWPTLEDKARVTAQARAELDLFLRTGERIVFPPVAVPAVSVVVVLWNAAEMTLRCLRALQSHAGVPAEIVLFDNGSADDTAALLDRVDGAVVIRHADNAGFVRGCNGGVAASRGQAVLLLNSDAVLRPGSLPAALETLLAAPTVGAVGARIVLSDGFLQEAGSVVWSDGVTAGYGRGQPPDWYGAMFRRDVDYCSGAFLITRRETWDALGGFDDRFSPAYYEDADFCLRLAARGLRVVYEPRAALDHFEFGSTQGGRDLVHALSVRNRKLFRALHADALHASHAPRGDGNLLAARARLRPGQRRLLMVDDLLPLAATGAGYPRAKAMVAEAVRQGWAVTLYASVRPPADWDAVRAEVSWEVEIVTGPGAPALPEFLLERDGHYEVMLVSRPGNMAAVRAVAAAHPHLLWGMRVVYDAEALFTHRDVLQAALTGAPVPTDEAAARLGRELALADGADAVACVSRAEAEAFRPAVAAPVRVLGHPGTVRRDAPGFAERSGLLFVGTLAIQASPNFDGMRWFVRHVWPLVRAALPGATLTLAGQTHMEADDLAGPGIDMPGPRADLAPLYDRARVFVSPVRYAAGIPLKIIDATFAGVPCAGTALMARLMDWQPGTQMVAADDPAELARGIADLHEDRVRWTVVRDAAAMDVTARFGEAEFRDTMAALLG